jgi:hypothetical protein
MNAANEQFEGDADERQVERLIQSALAEPPMSADFVNRLSRELDHEFALTTYYADNNIKTNGVAATNGHALIEAVAEPETVPFAATPTKKSPWRLMATVAAAAALLVAVGLWNSDSAYGWAAMLEALEKSEWVQAITRGGNDAEAGAAAAIGWFSPSRQIAAREAGESRVYLNFNKRTAENFDPAERVVRQSELVMSGTPTSEALLMMLVDGDSATATADLELVDESVKPTDKENEAELTVTLRKKSQPSELLRMAFVVNTKTNLPLSGRVLDGGQMIARSIEFSYPKQGPDSIFALGVPAAAPVVVEKSVKESSEEPIGEVLAGVERTGPSVVVEELVVAGGPGSPPAQPATEKKSVAFTEKTIDGAPAQVDVERIASAPVPTKKEDFEVPKIDPNAKALADGELVEKLNSLLAEFWKNQGITPAEPASDTEFLRRVYLDLTGRIPTVSEIYAFQGDASPDRRERLVDDLLGRRDHATHLAAIWRTVLLPEGVDLNTYGGTNKFDSWLADRFGQNMPYDEIVRQLLLAEGRVSESGPLLFYASLKLNPEEIAAKTSRVFLGTRMECAQCHDHPFDDRIAQTDFWGFAAHFAQISRPEGKMEMTSPVLRVADNDFGEVKIPDTEDVVPPHLPGAVTADIDAKDSQDPTGMERSRRQQLVDWLTTKNNDAFSRAAVNRVWQQVFGRGLVEPVDDMRPDNKPVSPEVLDLLTQDFAASGFDLRRLLRALVLTDAYQLSSGSPTDEPAQALCFARMNLKNFTADQLYDCIAVATLSDTSMGQEGALARTANGSRQAFIEQFRAAPGDRTAYQAGVPQALTLMHGTVVHGATDLTTSGLLKSLNAPFFSDEQRLDTLFLATLCRAPEPAEREKLLAYLGEAKDSNERLGVLGDVLWALLNSAEFTFIH